MLKKSIFPNFGGGLHMKMVEVKFSALFIENPILDWPTNLATCI